LFVDEAGFYPLPPVVTTYAPVGETPVPREVVTRDHLFAISAVTPNILATFPGGIHHSGNAEVSRVAARNFR